VKSLPARRIYLNGLKCCSVRNRSLSEERRVLTQEPKESSWWGVGSGPSSSELNRIRLMISGAASCVTARD
jgi:hypothetical protein